jgi:hypothetical protein
MLRPSVKKFTMSNYAAEHWLHHARFEDTATREDVRLGIERLFAQETTFAAWLWLYDMDNPTRGSMITEHPEQPAACPLYYAALCGLPMLVKYLAEKFPDTVNNQGGAYGTPLHDVEVALVPRRERCFGHGVPIFLNHPLGYDCSRV